MLTQEIPDVSSAPVVMPTCSVTCESTACLPHDLVERYAIGVVPVPVRIGAASFLDGVDIRPRQVYERLAAGPVTVRTSAPSPGQYLEAWHNARRLSGAILHVTVAASLSTFCQTALLAADLDHSAAPPLPVEVLDSGSAAMGQGFVALAAARAAWAGHSLPAIQATARAVSREVRLLVTLDTLEYLARVSRVPRAAALLGGLLDLKPIFELAGGEVRPLARTRTRRRSLMHLMERVMRSVPEGASVHLAVHHAQADEEAAVLAAHFQQRLSCTELYVTEFTPVMGTYCGPGLLGVAYYVEDADIPGPEAS
jgi:DegV family protein with EDD domain